MNDFGARSTFGLAVGLAVLAPVVLAEPPSPKPREQLAQPSSVPPSRRASTKPDVSAQRFCDALHALPAKRKGQCCGTTPASLAAVCAQELSVSVRNGAVTLDAAQIDRCSGETARQLEGCEWVGPLMPPVPDACRGVIHGQLKAEARCRSSLECPQGLFCKGMGPGQEGVCAAPVAARARCEVPSDNLAAFTGFKDDPGHPACDGLCIKGQCLPLVPIGGTCQSSAQCVRGLNCISKRCQARALPKIGEPCAGDTPCESGTYCQAGRCRPLKSAGEPCTLPFECRAIECAKAPGAPGGTCGEPCGAPPRPPAKRGAPSRMP